MVPGQIYYVPFYYSTVPIITEKWINFSLNHYKKLNASIYKCTKQP